MYLRKLHVHTLLRQENTYELLNTPRRQYYIINSTDSTKFD